jgi:hypothetical protein
MRDDTGDDYAAMLIAEKYCFLPFRTSSWTDIDWNDYCVKHREYLKTPQGAKTLEDEIKKGKFGTCPDCNVPLIPVGRRNKPCIAKLWLVCPCDGEIVENIDAVDSAAYGNWVNLKKPDPPWIAELKKDCPK